MKRGEIYFAELGDVIGSEQGGGRPVLIIQNDVGNKYSPTTIVATITTSKIKHDIPTHYKTMLLKPSIILFEQIRTIDKSRIRKYIGYVDPKKWEKQLKISLGLE